MHLQLMACEFERDDDDDDDDDDGDNDDEEAKAALEKQAFLARETILSFSFFCFFFFLTQK